MAAAANASCQEVLCGLLVLVVADKCFVTVISFGLWRDSLLCLKRDNLGQRGSMCAPKGLFCVELVGVWLFLVSAPAVLFGFHLFGLIPVPALTPSQKGRTSRGWSGTALCLFLVPVTVMCWFLAFLISVCVLACDCSDVCVTWCS